MAGYAKEATYFCIKRNLEPRAILPGRFVLLNPFYACPPPLYISFLDKITRFVARNTRFVAGRPPEG
jgi:hypothetical protein